MLSFLNVFVPLLIQTQRYLLYIILSILWSSLLKQRFLSSFDCHSLTQESRHHVSHSLLSTAYLLLIILWRVKSAICPLTTDSLLCTPPPFLFLLLSLLDSETLQPTDTFSPCQLLSSSDFFCVSLWQKILNSHFFTVLVKTLSYCISTHNLSFIFSALGNW